MKYHELGKTGFHVSAIGYGGVVSSQHFDEAVMQGGGQKMSDHFVSWAVEQGINYFDVAPKYGDAQILMGNSLKPFRDKVFLACKTAERKRAGQGKRSGGLGKAVCSADLGRRKDACEAEQYFQRGW